MKNFKKVVAMLGVVVSLFALGCSSGARSSVWKANSSANGNTHGWETPAFTSDLDNNPISSEVNLGLVTLRSSAGWASHPTRQWVSLGGEVGPQQEPVRASSTVVVESMEVRPNPTTVKVKTGTQP